MLTYWHPSILSLNLDLFAGVILSKWLERWKINYPQPTILEHLKTAVFVEPTFVVLGTTYEDITHFKIWIWFIQCYIKMVHRSGVFTKILASIKKNFLFPLEWVLIWIIAHGIQK